MLVLDLLLVAVQAPKTKTLKIKRRRMLSNSFP